MPPRSEPADGLLIPAPPSPVIGLHLIIDFWEAHGLTDAGHIDTALRDAAAAAGAIVLDVSLHEFADHDGITGVALLAESHISVHTWPEHGYAAFDVFICGAGNPHRALQVLDERFSPGQTQVKEISRGRRDGLPPSKAK